MNNKERSRFGPPSPRPFLPGREPDTGQPEANVLHRCLTESGKVWLACLVLGVITLALYTPSLWHDFLAYDDQQYVTENPHVQAGLNWRALVWSFGFHASNWHPLTWLSHIIDCQIYGLRPWGHHLTSVLLHAANTVLLFIALRRMTGAIWRSACVAALFGWHPLHVESVAWIAERKDVLSAFFFMLTLITYTAYSQSKILSLKSKVGGQGSKGEGRGSREAERSASLQNATRHALHAPTLYALTLLVFTLGLMSKPMLVTLPFVLLLLDFWPLRRGARGDSPGTSWNNWWSLVLEKAPFFILSATCSVLTVVAQEKGNALVSVGGLSVADRITHSLIAYCFYLAVTLFPRHLAVFYPYPKHEGLIEALVAGAVLLLLSLSVLRLASRRPYLLVGWLWYLGILVPVIGLVQVGDQAWADRYTYLPLIGLFIGLVWFTADLSEEALKRTWVRRRALFVASAAAAGAAILTTTSIQLRYWKNTRDLFERAIKVTRHNARALTMVGSLLVEEGHLDEAMKLFDESLVYQPTQPETHFHVARVLEKRGDVAGAIAEYDQALWFKPLRDKVHVFLGLSLVKQGKLDEAAAHYREALALNPESAGAHNNLARVLHTQGRPDEAMEHYRRAIELDPSLAQAHNNLGVIYLQKGESAEGAAQLREALRLNPGDPQTEYNLARALNQQSQWEEAVQLFAKTVGASKDPQAHYEFATALAHLHKTRQARSEYAGALIIQPDFPDALDGLSWILATAQEAELRNGTQAVQMAERACELTQRKDPAKLKTLAAAYAETGRFSEAIESLKLARDLKHGNTALDPAEIYDLMQQSFAAARPWRETTTNAVSLHP